MTWLTWVLVAAAVMVVLWLLLAVAARVLPPGRVRELVAFLPAFVTMARQLRRDPRVPRRVKIVILLAGLWVISPIDLVPEFLPVIGPLDDVIVIVLALRYAARHIPTDALDEACPADSPLLRRALGLEPDDLGTPNGI